jgi:hypothetical protein
MPLVVLARGGGASSIAISTSAVVSVEPNPGIPPTCTVRLVGGPLLGNVDGSFTVVLEQLTPPTPIEPETEIMKALQRVIDFYRT